jgi:hypothetical protein
MARLLDHSGSAVVIILNGQRLKPISIKNIANSYVYFIDIVESHFVFLFNDLRSTRRTASEHKLESIIPNSKK